MKEGEMKLYNSSLQIFSLIIIFLFSFSVYADVPPDNASARLEKIIEFHHDYLGIVNSQMFKDYISSLPSQRHKATKHIIKSGTAKEVIELITQYKKQGKLQKSHRSMIINMVNNYKGTNRKFRAMKAIQDWINENEDASNNPSIVKLKVRKTNTSSVGQSYLISYIIARGTNKQKYLYEVNPYAETVRTVSEDE